MTPLIHANLREIHSHAIECLVDLVALVSGRTHVAIAFDTAQAALEALPLNTEEIAIARNRLANARNYLESKESGAARFELLLLVRALAGSRPRARTSLAWIRAVAR